MNNDRKIEDGKMGETKMLEKKMRALLLLPFHHFPFLLCHAWQCRSAFQDGFGWPLRGYYLGFRPALVPASP